MRNASVEEVLDLLRRGLPLRELLVAEPISIESLAINERITQPIEIVGCQLHSLNAISLRFESSVVIKDSLIENTNGSFAFSYFLGGLIIQECTFESKVDFQCGGHNKNSNCFLIADSTFKKFVNFFDCWFEGPVEIRNCDFEAGTNLLGNQDAPYAATFKLPPVIENNIGVMNLSGG